MKSVPIVERFDVFRDSRARLADTPEVLKRLLAKHRRLARRYRLVKKGLDRAARVQRSLLPVGLPSLPGYQFAHIYRPCEAVGGDFYDFVECESGLLFIVSDVIGHGFEAALSTMLLKVIFEETASVLTEPVDILKRMNTRLHRILPEGMFAAAAIVKVVDNAAEVQLASAGLPYPFWIHASQGRVDEVELAGFPLGLFDGGIPLTFDARTLTLVPKDVLLVGSDGLHAIAGANGDSVEGVRLSGILTSLAGRNGAEVIEGLMAEVCGSEPLPDDLNLLAITRSD